VSLSREETKMILPFVRASVGQRDGRQLAELMAFGDSELLERARERLSEDGVDSLLDDPRVLNALLTERDVNVRPAIVFYVLVRQALLEAGVDDRPTADYVTSVVLAFVRSGRAYRVSEHSAEEFHYLVDIVARMSGCRPREAFLLRAHLGDFSLWLSGLFPDLIESRVRRRGAPPMRYYEEMGATGYTMASESPEAQALGVAGVFTEVSKKFTSVRGALNRVSDRYLYPSGGNPVDRLLRQVAATAT
jgi:hypothetical protein